MPIPAEEIYKLVEKRELKLLTCLNNLQINARDPDDGVPVSVFFWHATQTSERTASEGGYYDTVMGLIHDGYAEYVLTRRPDANIRLTKSGADRIRKLAQEVSR